MPTIRVMAPVEKGESYIEAEMRYRTTMMRPPCWTNTASSWGCRTTTARLWRMLLAQAIARIRSEVLRCRMGCGSRGLNGNEPDLARCGPPIVVQERVLAAHEGRSRYGHVAGLLDDGSRGQGVLVVGADQLKVRGYAGVVRLRLSIAMRKRLTAVADIAFAKCASREQGGRPHTRRSGALAG